MASDEEIPAVSDVENAKKSDGTSTAGEHNTDQVNGTEIDEQRPVDDEEEDNQSQNLTYCIATRHEQEEDDDAVMTNNLKQKSNIKIQYTKQNGGI